MWREGKGPDGRLRLGMRSEGPRVEHLTIIRVTPDEVAPLQERDHAWPAMGVHLCFLTGGNVSHDDADALVLEQQSVVFPGCVQRVEFF